MTETISNGGPCGNVNCKCCMWWSARFAEMNGGAKTCTQCHGDSEVVGKLQAENAALTEDNNRYKAANKELNAKANGIKTEGLKSVPAADPQAPKRRGRPSGQPATINKRPGKIDRCVLNDFDKCPECGEDNISHVVDSYPRVVQVTRTITENVEITTTRRYCRDCRKLVSRKVPGVAPYARVSANQSAAMVKLNMVGLSHGKVADFWTDTSGVRTSRSRAYRNKMTVAKRLAPRRDAIRRDILREPYLQCDEYWWPLGKKSGYVLSALGKKGCLMQVSYTRKIEELMRFLPGYDGIVGNDPYPGWLHIGSDHQMCEQHEIRLPKKDLKYRNPKGDVREFLLQLIALIKRYFEADKIEDPYVRRVAADCLDESMRQLMNADWEDDSQGTINRYRKRYRREGYYLSTFLRKKGVKSGNNDVERMNRKFVSIRDDGGGNRSPEGMEANSILFTVYATSKVINTSFFEEIIRYSSGDG